LTKSNGSGSCMCFAFYHQRLQTEARVIPALQDF
jgi:hypothetical protein